MQISAYVALRGLPRTEAVRRALCSTRADGAVSDLLFLETWEAYPVADVAATLRAGQIRRANPALAAEIRAELQRHHPLSDGERAELVKAD